MKLLMFVSSSQVIVRRKSSVNECFDRRVIRFEWLSGRITLMRPPPIVHKPLDRPDDEQDRL
jgi:hypothetical protein